MAGPAIKNVACVGIGVIGRGWVHVFTRAGCRTKAYDAEKSQLEKFADWFETTLVQDVADGFLTTAEADRARGFLTATSDLTEALDGAEYIQESVFEKMDVKQAVHNRIDELADPKAIIGSSTSSLDMNEIIAGVTRAERCVLVHPFNPPHVVPAVEVMATERTSSEVLERTVAFLKSVGQKPMIMNFFAVGYLINRLQAAVVREAIHLVETGLCDVEAVDTAIKDGLGLRWALLGNFGTNNTNADGGIREYYTRYGWVYQAIMNDLDPTPPSFDPEMVERIGREVDAMIGAAPVSQVCAWRDLMVRKIRQLKEEAPHP